MSKQVKGVVSFTHAKDWPDRRTGEMIQLHSFKVEGDENFYRTGQDKPGFEKGQSITFEADDKNNVKLDSVTVLGTAVKAAPKVGRHNNAGYDKPVSRDDYWANKEARDLAKDERYQTVDIPRMTYCTSQDAAVALVASALQHECLPKIKSLAVSSRLGALLTMVDEITDRFYRNRMAAGVVEDDVPVEEEQKENTLDE